MSRRACGVGEFRSFQWTAGVPRDLEPQNIKTSLEGRVKVLDFGLAKAMDPAGAGDTCSSSATVGSSPHRSMPSALVTGPAMPVPLETMVDGESKVRVSSGGGKMPRWSAGGREIDFFTAGDSVLMAVPITTEPRLELGTPRQLFEGDYWTELGMGPTFAVSPDGARFLMLERSGDPKQSSELVVVQGWFAELGERSPAPR